MKKIKERFFLAQDGSCHWYLVPATRRAEWDAWRDLPEDDEDSWEAPKWAERLERHPSTVTFESPTRWKAEIPWPIS